MGQNNSQEKKSEDQDKKPGPQERKPQPQDKKPEHEEKRSAPRVERGVTVQYSIKELPPDAETQAFEQTADISHTRNLSETGIYFTTGQALLPQPILNISLRPPIREKTLSLEARVVDCEEIKKDFMYAVRAEFINLNDEQRELLRSYVGKFLKNLKESKGFKSPEEDKDAEG